MSLIELLVVLVVGGVLAAAVARSRATTRDAAAGAIAGADARRQLRAGLLGVEATLRGAADGDVLAVDDTVLELRVATGASVVCAVAAPGEWPPWATLLAPAPDRVQAAWHDAPAPGDELLALARAPGDSGAAWRWHRVRVADAPSPVRTDCGGRAGAPALRVPLDAPLPDEWAATGTPVRLLRRARWSVYRSGARWWLGWRDARPDGRLDVVQPVAGPHDRRASPAAPWTAGVRFARLAPNHVLATVSSTVVTAAGERVDSGVAGVALRNARP